MRNYLGDSIAHLEQKQATGTSCVVVRGGEAEGEEGGSPRMVVLPAAGACAGPMERTQAIRAQGKLLNYNCEINRIPYYPDGNSSAPIQCGECVPGISGAEDKRRLCGVNEYCTDEAFCASLTSSPLYLAVCPYEGSKMCGPGLICVKHVCIICEDGVYDPADGKTCFNGHWTYSEWETMTSNPDAVFLLVISILFFASLIRPLVVRKGSWRKGYAWKWSRRSKLLRAVGKSLKERCDDWSIAWCWWNVLLLFQQATGRATAGQESTNGDEVDVNPSTATPNNGSNHSLRKNSSEHLDRFQRRRTSIPLPPEPLDERRPKKTRKYSKESQQIQHYSVDEALSYQQGESNTLEEEAETSQNPDAEW